MACDWKYMQEITCVGRREVVGVQIWRDLESQVMRNGAVQWLHAVCPLPCRLNENCVPNLTMHLTASARRWRACLRAISLLRSRSGSWGKTWYYAFAECKCIHVSTLYHFAHCFVVVFLW